MDCSNSQSQAHSQAQAKTLTDSLNSLRSGFRLSSKCLGVGVLLLAMEAPVLAHLTHALEAPTTETELIEAKTEPETPVLEPEVEATASDEIEDLADAMADVVLGEDALIEDETAVVESNGDEIFSDAELSAEDELETGAGTEETSIEAIFESARSETEPEETNELEAPEEQIVKTPEINTDTDDSEVEATESVADESISPEDSDPAEAELAGDEGEDGSEVAEAEAPIPTLADRCAAPEATLFPPEPEVTEEGELAEGEADRVEAGEEAIAETPIESNEADPTADNPETASSEASDLETATEPPAEETSAEPDSPEEVAVVEPDTDVEDLDQEAKAEAAAKAAQEKEIVCALYKADQQYQAGELAEAKATYQLAKDPFAAEAKTLGIEQKPAITDPEALSAGGRVYLREAAAGREQNLETRVLVPLDLLVKQHPEFIPGQVQLSEALVEAGRSEDALALLEDASGRYPNEPELIKAHIALASKEGEWMDAVMLARRFAQLNPEHPQAEEFVALAEENMTLFQGDVRDRLRANTIANVLTGAVSVALTGSIWNSLSSIQTTALMLRGEEGVGNGISKSIKRQVELVEDEEIVDYIQAMGEELVAVSGREEFNYEFNILMDPNLNAFALPGGKIFVNAGAIAKTRSKAELAGLLSHELAHAVLSHGFRLVSDGSLLSDLSRFVPYGGYASNLVVLNYSRDMEREADELGARILTSAGYAADGLHGLMKTLGEQNTRKPLFAWMSTHPETDERVENLEEQISQEGLDRYQFEGVEEHFRMRVKVMRLIEEWKERKAKEEEERPWWR